MDRKRIGSFAGGWAAVFATAVLCASALPRAQASYKPVFDGVSLKGWHATGKGSWVVTDSAIVATIAAGGPESYLISDFSASDFSLKVKVFWVKGNSGVNFRNIQQGDLSNGIQVDIDGGSGTTGALYDNVKAAYVAKNDSIPKWFKSTDWNDLQIDAVGAKIKVWLNGHQTVAYTDTNGRKEGTFAFQLHVGMAMELRFKDIELMDLTATALADPRGNLRVTGAAGPAAIDKGVLHLPSGAWDMDGKRIGTGKVPKE